MSLQRTIERRQALLKLAERQRIYDALDAELHEKQLEVMRDTSRWISLLCGRRAGKTEFCARKIAKSLIRAGRGQWVLFGARTLAIAKDLIWHHLKAINEKFGLRWRMREDHGTIETRAGAKFRLLGVDDKVAIQKVRGYKVVLAIFDEVSTYQDHLKELIEQNLSPALSDMRGTLILSGTPGAVRLGYWFKASTGDAPPGEQPIKMYARHHWTVLDNPKFPRDAAEMLAEERAAFGWTEEDAAYQREYMARWVDDLNALVYAYLQERNAVLELPEAFDPETWLTTLGVDFGMTDECGWVVLGSPPHSKDIYVLHAEKHSGKLPDEAAAITAELYAIYKPSAVVGDGGGLGKPYVEEFNRRWAEATGIHITPADKADKVGAISLLNGDLRKPALKLWLPPVDPDALEAVGAHDLAAEIQHLPWLDAAKRKEHPGYSNHCSDAFLYAWRAHTNYWQRPSTPKKPEQSARERELEAFRSRQRKAQQAQKSKWFERPGRRSEAIPLPLAA